jgi:hypothetical protein
MRQFHNGTEGRTGSVSPSVEIPLLHASTDSQNCFPFARLCNRLVTTFADSKKLFLTVAVCVAAKQNKFPNQNPVPFCKKSCLRTS